MNGHLLLVFLFLINFSLFAADYEIKKSPSWVDNSLLEQSLSLPDIPLESQYGVSFKLSEKQIHVPEQTDFVRSLYHVDSTNGLAIGSMLNIDYAPSYQTVVLHKLNIIRQGKTETQLKPHQIRNFNIEQEQQDGVYNGLKRLNFILEDVKVNDLILFEYSIVGRNPVFKNHFFTELPLQRLLLTNKIRYRILHNTSKPINYKIHGFIEQKEFTEQAYSSNITAKDWQIDSPAPYIQEEGQPQGYIPYAWLQLTEFNSWADVRDWANTLFYDSSDLRDAGLYSDINEWIEKLYPNKTTTIRPDEKVYAIRNALRYTSTSEGVYSHQPQHPKTVIRKGFGDCKDKVNLMLALYNGFNISAHAALVNTKIGHNLKAWLPSPSAFNHAIVLFSPFNNKTYWVDLTQNPSSADLNQQITDDYGYSLILQSNEDELVPMYEKSPFVKNIYVEENFDLSESDHNAGKVLLNVNITFAENSAEFIRQQLKHDERWLNSHLMEMYQTMYPGLEPTDVPETILDKWDISVKFKAKFVGKPNAVWLKKFDKRVVQISSPLLLESLVDTISPKRQTPVAIIGPMLYQHEAQIKLPTHFPVGQNDINIENNNFQYQQTVIEKPRQLTLKMKYQSFSDIVLRSEFNKYNLDLNTFKSGHGLSLFVPDPANATEEFSARQLVENSQSHKASNLNWTLVLLSAKATIIFIFIALKIYKVRNNFKPKFEPDPLYQGFEGTLFYMLILISVNLLIVFASVFQIWPLFTIEVWQNLTTPTNPLYNSLWQLYIPFTVVAQIFIFVALILLAALFVMKKYLTKSVFIGLQISKILILISNFLIVKTISQSFNGSYELPSYFNVSSQVITVQVVFLISLTLYFILSKQVKHTFVN